MYHAKISPLPRLDTSQQLASDAECPDIPVSTNVTFSISLLFNVPFKNLEVILVSLLVSLSVSGGKDSVAISWLPLVVFFTTYPVGVLTVVA